MIKLLIQDSSKIIEVGFGEWLVNRIKSRLLSNIKKYKFQNLDKYLTEAVELNRLYKKKYTAEDIIFFASNNLVCRGTDGEVCVLFDNTKFVPGFDRLKLDTAVRIINFGTLSVKGCPIFTDTFNYFEKNIQELAEMYYGV